MAWTRINLLRALKFRIHRNSLQRIYFTFIRPLLEYSDVIWDNCSNECKTQLESIHNEATRIVSGAPKLCSIQKLLGELGWKTLQERRSKHKLIIFYKILNGLTPEYLSDLMPPLVSDINPYNLRNSDNVQSIRARTNIFFNSFFPSTIRAWNNLSEDIRNANTVNTFKSCLNRNRQMPSKYFNVGSRIEQILHARLRMEFSLLNSYLYRKNIFVLLISNSWDTETNPGPESLIDNSHFPCGLCDVSVGWEDRGICCDTCNIWYHIDCQGMSSTMYGIYNKSLNKSIAWECIRCGMPNFSTSLFDTTASLEVSNRFETLSSLSEPDSPVPDNIGPQSSFFAHYAAA